MLVNLATGLCQQGVRVDFITGNQESPYLSALPPQADIKSMKSNHYNELVHEFTQYLSEQRPSWVLTAKDKANKIALLARERSGNQTRLAFRVGTTISVKTKGLIFPKRWVKLFGIRKLYKKADLIIAVSKGVAEDVSQITGLPVNRISVISNPVVTQALYSMAEHPVEHPWFLRHELPIILGAGGFRRAKDFPTLIRAFARVRERLPCKLVILGRGRQERLMKKVAEDLGVTGDMSFPGFNPNPYPYMAQADVFALSSRWEGSPNVLTEALALGTPVVSTDCESGPREILQYGRYGPLVPVGDVEGLARAIEKTLDDPLPAGILRSAVGRFTAKACAEAYLKAIGLGGKQAG